MKINRNFIQIGLTALITSAVFLININYFQKKSPDILALDRAEPSASSGTTAVELSSDTILVPMSEPLPWSDAQDRMADYMSFNTTIRPIMKTKSPIDGSINILKGFSFETAHLLDIMKKPDGTMVDSVLFMFGAEGTFNESPATRWPHLRIIAVGVTNNVVLSTRPVYDKADPCPPFCPSGL